VRLLALFNIAMADAGVVAWRAKYLYNVWRPILGIREHPAVAQSGAAKRDGEWVPLGAPNSNQPPDGDKDFTPPFPAYPSGHATFGAACFEALKRFRAERGASDPDAIDIDVVSDELNGVTTDAGQSEPRVSEPVVRHFSSIEEMIRQNLESRVFPRRPLALRRRARRRLRARDRQACRRGGSTRRTRARPPRVSGSQPAGTRHQACPALLRPAWP
jgi:vanadium chloroperoxidase